MMFGLFSRKQPPQPHPIQQQNTEIIDQLQQLRTPSPSIDSHLSPSHHPPLTPSPPPVSNHTPPSPQSLHDLFLSVPPQTLHTYAISHLAPPAQPSPAILAALTTFFHDLAPPPRLHCVRCHKPFFAVENTDRSCLIPHDDESAEVERVGATSKAKGTNAGSYETLWGCCGRTVEGDGDMGPPDGWCYEGKHTTDTKRARFRADSTLQDDKLTSCARLRCHGGPAPRSTRAHRKRARALADQDGDDNDDDVGSGDESSVSASAHSVSTSHRSSSGRRPIKKPRTTTRPKKEESEESADEPGTDKDKDKDKMDVDETHPTPASPPKPKRKPRTTKPKPQPSFSTPKTSSPLVLAPPFVSHSASPEPLKAQAQVIVTTMKPHQHLKQKSSTASLKPKSSAASLKPKSTRSGKQESGTQKSVGEPPSPRKSLRHVSPAKGTPTAKGKPKEKEQEKEKEQGVTKPRTRAGGKDLVEVVDSSIDGERVVPPRR